MKALCQCQIIKDASQIHLYLQSAFCWHNISYGIFSRAGQQAFRNPPRDSKRATERSFPPFFGFQNRAKANRCCCCSTIISTVVHPKTTPWGHQNSPVQRPKRQTICPQPLPCPIGKLPRNLGGMFPWPPPVLLGFFSGSVGWSYHGQLRTIHGSVRFPILGPLGGPIMVVIKCYIVTIMIMIHWKPHKCS